MKFIDPSYSVRSIPANAADALYCMQLAQAAVYGAMAGSTGFTVGMVNNRICYIPIPLVVATSPRFMNPNGDIWNQVLAMTGQPQPDMSNGAGATKSGGDTNAFQVSPELRAHC
jgi:6-phosphofructokinase 1